MQWPWGRRWAWWSEEINKATCVGTQAEGPATCQGAGSGNFLGHIPTGSAWPQSWVVKCEKSTDFLVSSTPVWTCVMWTPADTFRGQMKPTEFGLFLTLSKNNYKTNKQTKKNPSSNKNTHIQLIDQLCMFREKNLHFPGRYLQGNLPKFLLSNTGRCWVQM